MKDLPSFIRLACFCTALRFVEHFMEFAGIDKKIVDTGQKSVNGLYFPEIMSRKFQENVICENLQELDGNTGTVKLCTVYRYSKFRYSVTKHVGHDPYAQVLEQMIWTSGVMQSVLNTSVNLMGISMAQD